MDAPLPLPPDHFWDAISGISALIAAIATCVTAWLTHVIRNVMKDQNNIIQRQTDIQKEQTAIFDEQTKILSKQTDIYELQNDIYERQIKLDLFDKRFAVYEMCAVTINKFATFRDELTSEIIGHVDSTLESSEFLFDDEIHNYVTGDFRSKTMSLLQCLLKFQALVQEARQNGAFKYHTFEEVMSSHPGMQALDIQREEFSQFFEQEGPKIKKMLAPYLDFKDL